MVNVRNLMEQDLRTCNFLDLKSDLYWNTEKINYEDITTHGYDFLFNNVEEE